MNVTRKTRLRSKGKWRRRRGALRLLLLGGVGLSFFPGSARPSRISRPEVLTATGPRRRVLKRAGCEVYLRHRAHPVRARETRAGGATRGEVVVARNGMSWFANRSCRKRKKRFSKVHRDLVGDGGDAGARETHAEKPRALRARSVRSEEKGARVSPLLASVPSATAQTPRLLRNLSRKRTSIADGVESKAVTIRQFFIGAPDQSNERMLLRAPSSSGEVSRFTTRRGNGSGRVQLSRCPEMCS